MGDFSKEMGSTFSNVKVKAMLNILFTANWINGLETAYFRSFDISPQQYNILRILRGAGKALPVQIIKERMLERAPNTTRLLDKLSSKFLVERVPCKGDRRIVHIEITGDGLQLLKRIDHEERVNLLENLSLDEASQLSNLLDKIR